MSSTAYRAWDHKAWSEANLKDYEDFSDCIEYVNQSEYGDGQLEGEWWYDDDAALTIYWGTFGNDWAPGASHDTYADVYEDLVSYAAAKAEWEAKPEYLEDEDDLEDEDLDYDEGEDNFESSDSVDDDGGPESEVGCPDARMIVGYAHQWFNEDDSADDMEMIVHNPSFTERPIRIQMIDGSPHVVFWSPELQCFLAQTCVSLGVPV